MLPENEMRASVASTSYKHPMEQKGYQVNKIYDVAQIVGGLRKDSINRKVAKAIVELAPCGSPKLHHVVVSCKKTSGRSLVSQSDWTGDWTADH